MRPGCSCGKESALHRTDESLDVGRGDLRAGEPHDAPSGKERFEILLGIGDEAGAAVVASAALDINAALDLDECAALDVREICAPLALWMKAELAFQFRPAEPAPVEGEFRFESRTAGFGPVAEAGHGLRLASNDRKRPLPQQDSTRVPPPTWH